MTAVSSKIKSILLLSVLVECETEWTIVVRNATSVDSDEHFSSRFSCKHNFSNFSIMWHREEFFFPVISPTHPLLLTRAIQWRFLSPRQKINFKLHFRWKVENFFTAISKGDRSVVILYSRNYREELLVSESIKTLHEVILHSLHYHLHVITIYSFIPIFLTSFLISTLALSFKTMNDKKGDFFIKQFSSQKSCSSSNNRKQMTVKGHRRGSVINIMYTIFNKRKSSHSNHSLDEKFNHCHHSLHDTVKYQQQQWL